MKLYVDKFEQTITDQHRSPDPIDDIYCSDNTLAYVNDLNSDTFNPDKQHPEDGPSIHLKNRTLNRPIVTVAVEDNGFTPALWMPIIQKIDFPENDKNVFTITASLIGHTNDKKYRYITGLLNKRKILSTFDGFKTISFQHIIEMDYIDDYRTSREVEVDINKQFRKIHDWIIRTIQFPIDKLSWRSDESITWNKKIVRIENGIIVE